MVHFGVIGPRGGIGRRMPLLDGTRISRSGWSRAPQPPLSCAAVVLAMQSELHDRRARSLVAPRTPRVADRWRTPRPPE
jgi:hypothetical protein